PRRSASTSLMVLPLPQRTLTLSFLPSSSARAGIGWVVASAASIASRYSTRDRRRVMGAFLRCEEALHGVPAASGSPRSPRRQARCRLGRRAGCTKSDRAERRRRRAHTMEEARGLAQGWRREETVQKIDVRDEGGPRANWTAGTPSTPRGPDTRNLSDR